MPGYLDLARKALAALPPQSVCPEYEGNELNEQIPVWDQAAANALVVEIHGRRRQQFGEAGWPEGPAARRRLAEAMDRFDERWSARDLAGLRKVAGDLLALLSPGASVGADWPLVGEGPLTPADLPADC
jgi:hypothetical protein